MSKSYRERDWFALLPKDWAYAQRDYERKCFIWRAHKAGLTNKQIEGLRSAPDYPNAPWCSVSSIVGLVTQMKKRGGPGPAPIEEYLASEHGAWEVGQRCAHYADVWKDKQALAVAFVVAANPSPLSAFVALSKGG